MNATNCELLEDITGSDNPDDWSGPVIELFNDHTVRGPNGEKGGIRVRPAGKAEAKKSSPKTKEKEAEEDDEPFKDDEDADLNALDDED